MRTKVLMMVSCLLLCASVLVFVGPGNCGGTPCEKDEGGECVEGTSERDCPFGTELVDGRNLCPVEEGEPEQVCCAEPAEDTAEVTQ